MLEVDVLLWSRESQPLWNITSVKSWLEEGGRWKKRGKGKCQSEKRIDLLSTDRISCFLHH